MKGFLEKNWKILIIGLLCILLWKSCNKEPEIVEVPIEIKVPVPIVEKEFDTIKEPYPVYISGPKLIDSIYYKEYIKLKDSVAKDSMFKDAITIREYKEKVEDDTITINLYAKVRGTLQEYQIGYKTKPRFIDLDTVIKIAIPKKPEIYIGAGIVLPTENIIGKSPGIGPSASFINKKHSTLYSGFYDVINKEAGFKVEFRF